MSLHGTYDSQNIFALIIRGDLPCYKLYEDDDVLAFLDLFPQSRGHSLVIPKRAAARNILEIDDASLAKVMAVVKKVTQAVVDELLVRYVEALVYQAVAENMASEQSARMVAMKAASDNAKTVISELQLVYNKSRQAAITKELSEIVGGAAAV